MDDKKKIEDIAAALMGAGKEASKTKRAPARRSVAPTLSLVVSGGSGTQVAARDIHNHTTIHNFERLPKPIVVVQTGVGVISAQQKHKLLELRDRAVEASTVGMKPKTPAMVMGGLNKHMRVNSYSEILAADFDQAAKWLTRQRAIKTSLPSAKKKLPDWRNGRIRAVHARCKEKGFETWRIEYMRKKFAKESMVDLGDDDLEVLYRAVMAKK